MNDEISVYYAGDLGYWIRVVPQDEHALKVKALQYEILRLQSLLEFDLDECK